MIRHCYKLTLLPVLLFVMAAATIVIDGGAYGEQVTVDRLTKDLLSMDIERIRRTLKVTATSTDKPAVRTFILDLWYERRNKYPKLPWDIINAPQIRIYVAQLLVVASHFGYDGLQPKDLRDYAWSVTDSPDDDVVRAAFTVIGSTAGRDDIPRIEEYLADPGRTTFGGFYGAIGALAYMCYDDAAVALDRLQKQRTDSKKLEILKELRQRWHGHCRF